jgi:CRP-like cAMP-binding protein
MYMSDKDHSAGTNGSTADSLKPLLDFIRSCKDVILLPRSTPLFQEGEPCRGAYFVEEGELQLTITSAERRIKIGSAVVGQIIGISSVITGSDHQCSSFAARDSKVIFLPADVLRQFLQEHAESCLLTIQRLGSDLLDLSTNAIRPLRSQPRYPRPQ